MARFGHRVGGPTKVKEQASYSTANRRAQDRTVCVISLMGSIPELANGLVALELECLDRRYLKGYIGPPANTGRIPHDVVYAGGTVRLVFLLAAGTRTSLSVTCAPAWLPLSAILDSEIVFLGPDGRPRFMDLIRRRGPQPFIAFDLLWLNGPDLTGLPLVDRKAMLKADHQAGIGRAIFGALRDRRRPSSGPSATWTLTGSWRSARTAGIRRQRRPGSRSRTAHILKARADGNFLRSAGVGDVIQSNARATSGQSCRPEVCLNLAKDYHALFFQSDSTYAGNGFPRW